MSLLTADEMECLLTQGASATRAPPYLHSPVHFTFEAFQLDCTCAAFEATRRCIICLISRCQSIDLVSSSFFFLLLLLLSDSQAEARRNVSITHFISLVLCPEPAPILAKLTFRRNPSSSSRYRATQRRINAGILK